MLSIAIRPAAEVDAQRICELHISSVRGLCSAFYKAETIEGWLENRSPQGYLRGIHADTIFVAEDKSRIVGFGEAIPGEVLAIFVDPTEGRRGIGSELLKIALSRASTPPADTIRVEATLNAVGFYEKHGFVEVERAVTRRNQTDIPAVVMIRPVD